MKKENARWVLAVIKAKVVAVADLRLVVSGVVALSSITLYSMLKLLTHTPDWMKMEERRWNLMETVGVGYLVLAVY